MLISPLEKKGSGVGAGGVCAKEKGNKEVLCEGAEIRGRAGEAEGGGAGGGEGVERARAGEGESDEEGMESVEGLERGRGGLDEVRKGNEGLVTEGNGEVGNEESEIGMKGEGGEGGREGGNGGSSSGSGAPEGIGEHRSGTPWGGAAAAEWEASKPSFFQY